MRESHTESHTESHFEAIVVGTGFAGAVTACRLGEAKVRTCVLERGRRYDTPESDFPVYPRAPLGAESQAASDVPDFSRLLWGLSDGVWDFRDLGDVLVAQAAGYGGGSLIYANVHLRAPADVLRCWPDEYHRPEFDRYYDLVAFMLDVQQQPEPAGDPVRKTVQLQRAATAPPARGRIGRGPDFAWTKLPLAINFEDKPKGLNRFDRAQKSCDLRGDCCFGCSRHAKNTLDLNYLADAENSGFVEVRTLAEVLSIRSLPAGGYQLEYTRHLEGPATRHVSLTCDRLFLCAGAVNTTELLLRARAAKRLPIQSSALGRGYFTNADSMAAVFDCDELHEVDRGPTITSGLVYHREPQDDDPLARWTIRFGRGNHEPSVGSPVVSSGGARAVLAGIAPLEGGRWETGTASGELVLSDLVGHLHPGDALFCRRGPKGTSQIPVGICESAPVKASHWLMFQDGGMPSELEPLVGVFRSPLWIRRNRYRESKASPPLVTQRGAFAKLPFENLSQALTSLAGAGRGTLGSEVGRKLVERLGRGSQHRERSWSLLPDQLRRALEADREFLLDTLAVLAEPSADKFLEEAGKQLEQHWELETWVRQFPVAGQFDPSLIRRVKVAERALRLGVQFGWGSQAGMIRHAAERFLVGDLFDDGRWVRRLTDLLGWALDYRVGDGRTAMILAMGRDTLPGRLRLAEPERSLRPGDRLIGQESGAVRIVVAAVAEEHLYEAAAVVGGAPEIPSTNSDAKGRPGVIVVVRDGGDLVTDETVLVEGLDVGYFQYESQLDSRDAPLFRLQLSAQPSTSSASQKSSRGPLPALRADLPTRHAATELRAQELLFRDLAERWNGELRTQPLGSFLEKRITAHSQGGCPMGSDPNRSATDPAGRVRGCPGLYVMDGAAFPSSVGVNPSATIAAVAERKIETILRVDFGLRDFEAKEMFEARPWARSRAALLDPDALTRSGSNAPGSRPVGIEFRETLRGWAFAPGSNSNDPDGRIQLFTRLKVTIHDLTRFLDLDALGRPEPLRVCSGFVYLAAADLSPSMLFAIDTAGKSRIWLRREPVLHGRERRILEYHLDLRRRPRSGDNRRFSLTGHKVIHDDEGLDLWEDTTTLLEVQLSQRCGQCKQCEQYEPCKLGQIVLEKGLLRSFANDFFGHQLPKTRATGTRDPARQSWALAAFGHYFFGHLVDVYVPELDQVVDVVKTIGKATHV